MEISALAAFPQTIRHPVVPLGPVPVHAQIWVLGALSAACVLQRWLPLHAVDPKKLQGLNILVHTPSRDPMYPMTDVIHSHAVVKIHPESTWIQHLPRSTRCMATVGIIVSTWRTPHT
jgi:hypothetical protein